PSGGDFGQFEGESCSSAGEACAVPGGDACYSWTSHYVCTAQSVWKLERRDTNDGCCPDIEPTEGDACVVSPLADGLHDCEYPSGATLRCEVDMWVRQ